LSRILGGINSSGFLLKETAFQQALGRLADEAAAVLPLTADRKVDARALHEWLGVKSEFRLWFHRIVKDYGFEEGEGFVASLIRNPTGGRPRKDYLLTLDVAKEVAMIGNTPKGKATRSDLPQMFCGTPTGSMNRVSEPNPYKLIQRSREGRGGPPLIRYTVKLCHLTGSRVTPTDPWSNRDC
jgi:phage anti-repressor protein